MSRLAFETRGQSRRHACALLSVARSGVGYTSRLVARDAPALAVMRELAGHIAPATGASGSSCASRARDECRARAARGGWWAGSPGAARTDRDRPAAPDARDRAESRLGVRFRVRRVRQRSDAEVSDAHDP